MNVLIVAIGGMLSSVCRYIAGTLVLTWSPNLKFPLGTFIVNIVGCFLIGIIASLVERTTIMNPEVRLFCVTGF